jgi:hypothetical protein
MQIELKFMGGFHDQGDGRRPKNRHLKGCFTENFLLQVGSMSLGMLKNAFG